MHAAVRGSESPEVQWTYETCTTDDRVARCPIGVRLLERQSATEGDAQMWQVSSKVSSSTLRGTAPAAPQSCQPVPGLDVKSTVALFPSCRIDVPNVDLGCGSGQSTFASQCHHVVCALPGTR